MDELQRKLNDISRRHSSGMLYPEAEPAKPGEGAELVPDFPEILVASDVQTKPAQQFQQAPSEQRVEHSAAIPEAEYGFYSGWRNSPFYCYKHWPSWRGTHREMVCEPGEASLTYKCPTCQNILARVSEPTGTEADLAGPHLSRNQQLDALRHFRELPEIPEQSFALHFDTSVPNTYVVRHGDRIIWTEPIGWEDYFIFNGIAEVLVAKYGHRLQDLIPTSAAENWMFGDIYYIARPQVNSVREWIRQQAAVARAEPAIGTGAPETSGSAQKP